MIDVQKLRVDLVEQGLAASLLIELLDRLEAAERERDEYQRQYLSEQELRQTMQQEVNRIEAREQALAAYVELISDLESDLSGAHKGTEEYDDKLHALRKSIESAPATSLARLKAQWQVEVLEWARNRVRLGGRDHAERIIGLRVESLRNQAKGEQS